MQKFISIMLILIAGETVFMLPFLIPRLLRPIMLEVWGITNQDIGLAFSAYGFTAMVSYFFGGPLADKYPPQKLLSLSLVLTAAAGLLLINPPSAQRLVLVYSLFGVSTILFLWGAMIKLTHLIGGESSRASAMGFLDAGRGLSAALMSSFLVFLISRSGSSQSALSEVYLWVCGLTALLSVLVWFGIKLDDSSRSTENKQSQTWTVDQSLELLRRVDIWLLSLVVLASYCGYKSVDNYALYLVKVQGLDLTQASQITSAFFWLRPVGALGIGIFADFTAKKLSGSRFIILTSLLSLAALSQLLLALKTAATLSLAITLLSLSALMAYGLRAIYFAVFGDLRIPNHLIGTAVGFVSVVGFLPDFFFGSVTGAMLDAYPGESGFRRVFFFSATILLGGALATMLLWMRKKSPKPD